MILQAQVVTHPSLPGVSVLPIGDDLLQKGKPQQILVVMRPYSQIPLHQHSVDAEMFVVSGSAKLVSDDEFSGRYVTSGTRVLFGRDRNHGFEATAEGMSFLSTNGGIVDEAGDWDFTMKGGE